MTQINNLHKQVLFESKAVPEDERNVDDEVCRLLAATEMIIKLKKIKGK